MLAPHSQQQKKLLNQHKPVVDKKRNDQYGKTRKKGTRGRKTPSLDQQYGCLFVNSKCKVLGCCLIKFPPKDFKISFEQEGDYLPRTTCTPAEM